MSKKKKMAKTMSVLLSHSEERRKLLKGKAWFSKALNTGACKLAIFDDNIQIMLPKSVMNCSNTH